MKPLKTKVSITLDTDLMQSIKQLAEEDDRSFSQYINLILKEYLKNKSYTASGIEICYNTGRQKDDSTH